MTSHFVWDFFKNTRIQTLPGFGKVSCSACCASIVDDNTRISAFLNWSKSTWNKSLKKRRKKEKAILSWSMILHKNNPNNA